MSSSGGDDIDRLLKELDAFEGGSGSGGAASGASVPAKRQDATPDTRTKGGKEAAEGKGGGGRLAFAIIAAVVVGLLGAGVGMVLGPLLGWLPLIDFGFWSTGLGAALGGFLTALVAGPPRWFSS